MAPRPFSVLRRVVLPALAASAALSWLALAAPAQDVPPDGLPRRIERAADIPPELLYVMLDANCSQDDTMLSAFPIEIFRPAAGSQPMAIVPCAGVVLHGRAFLFDRGLNEEPRPMALPVMPFAGRVTNSEAPGLLTWNPQTRTLVALQGNDECDGVVARHTYRHGSGRDLNGFALAKVERGKLGCGDSENWQVVWEADK